MRWRLIALVLALAVGVGGLWGWMHRRGYS
jgi:hypothetical protein